MQAETDVTRYSVTPQEMELGNVDSGQPQCPIASRFAGRNVAIATAIVLILGTVVVAYAASLWSPDEGDWGQKALGDRKLSEVVTQAVTKAITCIRNCPPVFELVCGCDGLT